MQPLRISPSSFFALFLLPLSPLAHFAIVARQKAEEKSFPERKERARPARKERKKAAAEEKLDTAEKPREKMAQKAVWPCFPVSPPIFGPRSLSRCSLPFSRQKRKEGRGPAKERGRWNRNGRGRRRRRTILPDLDSRPKG